MKPNEFLDMAERYKTFQKIKQELGELGTAFQTESTNRLSLRYCNKELSQETMSFLKGSFRAVIDTALEDLRVQMSRIEWVFNGVEVEPPEAITAEKKKPKDNRSFAIKH